MAAAATDDLAALAAKLGLDPRRDEEALQALLDDEVERLDAGAREALGAKLAAKPDAASVCPTCGNAVLLRFRGPRCRACGGRHKGEPRVARGLDDEAGAQAVVQEPAGRAALAALSLAPARKLGRKVELGADNEDWLIRAERIRKAAEEAERARKAAEEAARKKAAEEEARKKAAEEAERARKAAEAEAARKRAAEEAARKAKEEAERKQKEEEERIRREAAESEQRAKELEERRAREARRPSLGAVRGPRAGQLVRVDDVPTPATVGLQSIVWLSPDGQGRLHVPRGAHELVNGQERDGVVNLALGDLVAIGEELFVYDELAELENVQAPSLHFARNDTKPGGPWAYWNEEVKVGASAKCAVQVVDDGVDDEHARIYTKFGRVVVEDCSRSREAGVFVGGKKVPWALLQEGAVVKLGKDGPELKVAAGAADIKPKAAKAASMKPSRNVRTVLDVKDKRGGLFRRVILFSRREVRFGNVGRSREGKMLNELIIVPAPGEEAAVDEKQGALSLVRDGVEMRRDGKCMIEIDDAELPRGKGTLLQRGFTMLLGDDLIIEGRAYRSPTGVEQQKIPQLGMNGGHPIECVRLDRMNLPHSYVFLVRMLRIGSEATAPLRLPMPGVAEHHAQLLFVDGKFQILAPKAAAKVKVCAPAGAEKYTTEIELEPGVPTNLAIDTDIKLGDATLHFREAQDDDFQPPS